MVKKIKYGVGCRLSEFDLFVLGTRGCDFVHGISIRLYEDGDGDDVDQKTTTEKERSKQSIV